MEEIMKIITRHDVRRTGMGNPVGRPRLLTKRLCRLCDKAHGAEQEARARIAMKLDLEIGRTERPLAYLLIQTSSMRQLL